MDNKVKNDNFKTRKLSCRLGVTLVELTVIIIIIGILLMMAIPNAQQYIQTSEEQKRRAYMAIAVSAIQRWSADDEDTAVRPRDFNSVNTQGKRMYTYIKDEDVLRAIGTINAATGNIKVNSNGIFTFENGIMTVRRYGNSGNLDTFNGGPKIK